MIYGIIAIAPSPPLLVAKNQMSAQSISTELAIETLNQNAISPASSATLLIR
jgi:hypothetical protein